MTGSRDVGILYPGASTEIEGKDERISVEELFYQSRQGVRIHPHVQYPRSILVPNYKSSYCHSTTYTAGTEHHDTMCLLFYKCLMMVFW